MPKLSLVSRMSTSSPLQNHQFLLFICLFVYSFVLSRLATTLDQNKLKLGQIGAEIRLVWEFEVTFQVYFGSANQKKEDNKHDIEAAEMWFYRRLLRTSGYAASARHNSRFACASLYLTNLSNSRFATVTAKQSLRDCDSAYLSNGVTVPVASRLFYPPGGLGGH